MKVKNIMFSGFMAAILTGVACSADAATSFQVASKQYVDARDEAIVATQGTVDAKQDEDIAKKEDVANKVQTETAYNALGDQDDKTKLYTSVAVAEAIAGAAAAKVDVTDRVNTLETTVGTIGDSGLQVNGKTVTDIVDAVVALDKKTDGIATDEGLSELRENVNQVSGKVTSLESTVGDAESGLVKDVDTLETTVGNAESGLVKDVADLKTTKQDVLTADSYIDAAALTENKVKVVVDGQIAADNTGIVTGDAVYKYALPIPPEECSNTTCVLTTDQNGEPYWMQLWLPSDQEETPENGSDA